MYGECSNCSVLDDGYSLHLRAHCAYCTYTLTLLTAPTRSPCWLHLPHAHYTWRTILDTLHQAHFRPHPARHPVVLFWGRDTHAVVAAAAGLGLSLIWQVLVSPLSLVIALWLMSVLILICSYYSHTLLPLAPTYFHLFPLTSTYSHTTRCTYLHLLTLSLHFTCTTCSYLR